MQVMAKLVDPAHGFMTNELGRETHNHDINWQNRHLDLSLKRLMFRCTGNSYYSQIVRCHFVFQLCLVLSCPNEEKKLNITEDKNSGGKEWMFLFSQHTDHFGESRIN